MKGGGRSRQGQTQHLFSSIGWHGTEIWGSNPWNVQILDSPTLKILLFSHFYPIFLNFPFFTNPDVFPYFFEIWGGIPHVNLSIHGVYFGGGGHKKSGISISSQANFSDGKAQNCNCSKKIFTKLFINTFEKNFFLSNYKCGRAFFEQKSEYQKISKRIFIATFFFFSRKKWEKITNLENIDHAYKDIFFCI